MLDQVLDQRLVLPGSDSVTDPLCSQAMDRPPYAVSAGGLAGVGGGMEAKPPGFLVDVSKELGRK